MRTLRIAAIAFAGALGLAGCQDREQGYGGSGEQQRQEEELRRQQEQQQQRQQQQQFPQEQQEGAGTGGSPQEQEGVQQPGSTEGEITPPEDTGEQELQQEQPQQ